MNTKNKKLFTKKTIPFVTTKEKSIDIDIKEDLEIIHNILSKQ